MEHIKNLLPQVTSTQELTNCSTVSNRSFLPAEREILALKYSSRPFSKLSQIELLTVSEILLLKIHVITGWVVPEGKLQMILNDQFSKKLLESYPMVNVEEMEYAFRNNPVKDWGKSMNLNLIDEVMAPYLERRLELSRMEESKAPPALPPARITDEEFIESVRSIYNLTQDFRQIPVLAYKCLNLQLTVEEKEAIKTAVNGLISEPTNDNYKQFAVAKHFQNQLK